ncbi:MAG: sigma-70 family RNA polymerase sigma factor [Thermoleophilia bacterium]|nr:sigma-70 family RNA polymerase sigma factor [Thermoleophilia bacterium]
MISVAHALTPSLPFRLRGAPAPRPVVLSRRGESRDPRRLVSGIRRQDPAAVRELYETHGGTTFGFLMRTLGNRATAEDVQQEVWLDVWRRGATFDPGRGTLAAWIMQIARSRAIDQLRRRVPEPRDPSGAVALADGEDPAASVDALLGEWRVTSLLASLPAEQADLLRMRFADGLSQSEIAEQTGVALGTVKMRMVAGLRTLRVMLEDEDGSR